MNAPPTRRILGGADRSPCSSAAQSRPDVRRFLTRFTRALLLRCPVCGQGHVLASWFRLVPRCPYCGFALEREEGYFSGAMAVDLVATEVIITLGLLIAGILTWPSTPWDALWKASIAAALILPLALYPFSRTLWVAFDLIFRPPTEKDFPKSVARIR